MTSSVAAAGEVSVEGEHLGRIEGFRFVPDTTEGQADQKAVLSAALRALRQDLPARLQPSPIRPTASWCLTRSCASVGAAVPLRACCRAATSWRPR